jgi:beta-lactamase class A
MKIFKIIKDSKATYILMGIMLSAVTAYFIWPASISELAAKYSLLDPAAIVSTEQDLLVRFQPLRSAMLAQFENHEKFHIGLYFEYLPTGSNIVINNDRAMWPASLIKIPVAMAVMKKVERGEWRLDNQLVILDEDKDSSFGNLYLEPTGTTLTIEELLKSTLVDSDNTAHFVLLRNLDAEELEDVFTHLGLDQVLEGLKKNPDANSVDNRMTAKTYSVFFRSLFNATYLSPENSQIFLEYLVDSPAEYAKSGVPSDVVFTHKTGVREEDGVWADSGIVHEYRRPYILTIMIEKKNADDEVTGEEIEDLFKDISSQIYTYVHTL